MNLLRLLRLLNEAGTDRQQTLPPHSEIQINSMVAEKGRTDRVGCKVSDQRRQISNNMALELKELAF